MFGKMYQLLKTQSRRIFDFWYFQQLEGLVFEENISSEECKSKTSIFVP
jgi:hypothetical protein